MPVTPYFKVAILNVEDDEGLHYEMLNMLMDDVWEICADYGITDVKYADDFPQKWRSVFV